MRYVNQSNGWNSRYFCTLIRKTLVSASAERSFDKMTIYLFPNLPCFPEIEILWCIASEYSVGTMHSPQKLKFCSSEIFQWSVLR